MSTTIVGVIIGLFVLLLFLGVWLSAEYNTRSEKRIVQKYHLKNAKLRRQLDNAYARIADAEKELQGLQQVRHDLMIAEKRQLAANRQNDQLQKERKFTLQILTKLKKKSKELEFADSYLARVVGSHIDQIMEPEDSQADNNSETFQKIRKKING